MLLKEKSMERFSLAVMTLVLCFGFPNRASSSEDQPEREVQVGISAVYVPSGFGIDSEVYVVASGVFPNDCYRWNRAEVSHVGEFVHEVKSIARVNQGLCLMVVVAFSREVKLGKFAAGTHILRFLNGDGTYLEKSLSVEE